MIRDIPETNERTLISPVIKCGPHDINPQKAMEIVVPHCLYVDEVKKGSIAVYRCEQFTNEGRLSCCSKSHWKRQFFLNVKVTRTISTALLSLCCPGFVSYILCSKCHLVLYLVLLLTWLIYRLSEPQSWEKIPSSSERSCHSKAWFSIKKDSIIIKTKVFSIWSIFVCGGGGPKRKRVTAFASKPNPVTNLISLRSYIYGDNEDSKRVSNAVTWKALTASEWVNEWRSRFSSSNLLYHLVWKFQSSSFVTFA